MYIRGLSGLRATRSFPLMETFMMIPVVGQLAYPSTGKETAERSGVLRMVAESILMVVKWITLKTRTA